MTLGELFNLCQDIELRQAKLYAALSLRLGSVDERIARFWEQMSTEEWQHYILVDFGRSLCVDAFGIDSAVPALSDVPVQQITTHWMHTSRRSIAAKLRLMKPLRLQLPLKVVKPIRSICTYSLSCEKQLSRAISPTSLIVSCRWRRIWFRTSVDSFRRHRNLRRMLTSFGKRIV